MNAIDANRRPLKSRSTWWAQRLAAYLVSTGVSPNQISVGSVVFAGIGAAVLVASDAPWSLVVCAICIQLRLLCNLLDGMVALGGGKKSAVGVLYNEVPDRFADSMLIVAAGCAAQVAWLGWCGALLAMFTAYLRALGGALGLPQDFRGPLAKPQRMALLTVACLAGAGERAIWGTRSALMIGLVLIGVGSLATCVNRTLGVARALRSKLAENT
jgi:phosphatidylglycerophosphate synthase